MAREIVFYVAAAIGIERTALARQQLAPGTAGRAPPAKSITTYADVRPILHGAGGW